MLPRYPIYTLTASHIVKDSNGEVIAFCNNEQTARMIAKAVNFTYEIAERAVLADQQKAKDALTL